MSRQLHVALLCGGTSSEREVSLASGREVAQALERLGHRVTRFDPAEELGQLVAAASDLDVAFIALHGHLGEDGAIQGVLEVLGLPYQGCGVQSSALAIDKWSARQRYARAGLSVAPGMLAIPGDHTEGLKWVEQLAGPVVVKPRRGGSSVAACRVEGSDGLIGALEAAWAEGGDALVEAFVDGVELTGAVLGHPEAAVLPLVEIVPQTGQGLFDYRAKYEPGAAREICPARLAPAAAARAADAALWAHQALGCKDYSRTDMIWSKGRAVVLETNTIPGMTAGSLFPLAAAAAGMSFENLVARLLELALAGRTD